MKSAIVSILCSACLLFTGCLEVEEKTAFASADSGQYTVSIDMGKMIAQLKAFGGGEQLSNLPDQDSVMFFKNMPLEGSPLSAAEAKLIEQGTLTMHMDKAKEEMVLMITAPFARASDISTIRNALFKLASSRTKMPIPGMPASPMEGSDFAMIDINSLGFQLRSAKGSISNAIVDSASLHQRIENDSLLAQVKQVMPMMAEPVSYKSVFSFPMPVKNVTGMNALLSADKKSVIISNTLQNLFDNPKAFEYSIAF